MGRLGEPALSVVLIHLNLNFFFYVTISLTLMKLGTKDEGSTTLQRGDFEYLYKFVKIILSGQIFRHHAAH